MVSRKLVSAVLLLIAQGAGQASAADRYCGSRAVHFVCRHYGIQKVDLIDVIREIQPGEEPDGARLSDMSEFLAGQGIWAAPMSVDFATIAEVKEPIIVFLPAFQKYPAHYVVLVPQKFERTTTVWDGLAGLLKMQTSEFRRRATGECLVTARAAPPSAENLFVFRKSAAWTLNYSRAIAVAATLCTLVLVSRRMFLGQLLPKEAIR